jgi:hypothetical protein
VSWLLNCVGERPIAFSAGVFVMDMMPGRGGMGMASSAVAKYEQLE